MFLDNVLKLLGYGLGTLASLLAVAPLVSRRAGGWLRRLILASFAASGLWHLANAAALFQYANTGVEVNLPDLPGAIWYVPAVLCAAAALQTRFTGRWIFVAALGALVAARITGGLDSPAMVFASALAPAAFVYAVYRHNFLGLAIGRRFTFALSMGLAFAFYLFGVRRLADLLEQRFDAVRSLVEIAMIFAASLVWLPLYGWVTRFLAKRTRLYADFSRRVIEEAAHILDPERRLEFLARGVGQSLRLARVLVVAGEGWRLRGAWRAQSGTMGSEPGESPPIAAQPIEELARLASVDAIGAGDDAHPEARALLSRLGYNHVFPLRYENRLLGLLLVDTAPRLMLDEDEPVMVALSGQIAHSIEISLVIEEKIRLERALVEQDHLASLGKVAATIAHEFRNPLSSIKTLAQLLREDHDVDARYSRDLGYLVSETDRLSGSVQQLLSFSRPALAVTEDVDLAATVETAVDMLARQHAADGIRVERSIEPGLRLKQSNPELVRQIVMNLAVNAVQASGTNGVVRVAASGTSGGNAVIEVSDSGPGVPPEMRDRIFEPFFTTKQKGTGLGLAIVRKNVRSLGGEIRIDSPIENGRGTRLTVTLPLERPDR